MAKEDFKKVKDVEQPKEKSENISKTDSNTSSARTGEKFSAKTYELFGDAKDRTDTMMETISNSQTKIQACKAKLSDSEIFMGPIADSCKEAIDEMEKVLDLLVENYTTIGKYLIDSMNNYESGDKEASKLFLNVDENGKINVSSVSSSISEFAITPHSEVFEGDAERARRLEIVGGECGTKEEQDAKMTTIQVPYWDGNSIQQWNLTVNKNLTENYKNAFQAVADLKFVINPADGAGAYNYYHPPRSGGQPSDHTLGSAVDINVPNNCGSGDGSDMSVRQHEEVIKAFADQGFYWGGDWDIGTDDMHFTFTGF